MEGVRQLDHYIILFLGFENRYDVVVKHNKGLTHSFKNNLAVCRSLSHESSLMALASSHESPVAQW